jgi:anti-sigma factor RsiW
MNLMRITCHECQTHLVAYVHDELPMRARRRVAQHISRCDNCYALYAMERNLSNELRSTVPLVGQPNAPQLGRVWAAIQTDMGRSRPVMGGHQARFGLAFIILILALALPWTMDKRQVALALPPQPAARVVVAMTETPASDESASSPLSVTNAAIPAAETPNAPMSAGNTR